MRGVRTRRGGTDGRHHGLALLGGPATGRPARPPPARRGTTAAPAPRFAAVLTGDQQVPPVRTRATGTAQLEVADRGQALAYDVRAVRIGDSSKSTSTSVATAATARWPASRSRT